MTDEKLASIWFDARDEAEHAEQGTNVTRLRAFARRIAEIEREECAKVCEGDLSMVAWQCADKIRARGEK